MYLRFQRRIPLIPGLIYLNLAKTGISVSVGHPGFWLTFGRGGVRVTAGLPGSGISVSEQIPYKGRDSSKKT
ncbi:MAG: DUF4236 domain-containing protein [Methylohalobius sp.]|nr:DUF4236 domain-containing protein [Methylohalobius sp.]